MMTFYKEELVRLRGYLSQVDEVLIVNNVGPRFDGDYRQALSDLIAITASERECFQREEVARLTAELAALTRQRDEALAILTEARSEGMVWAEGEYGYKTADRVAAALSPARTAELAAMKEQQRADKERVDRLLDVLHVHGSDGLAERLFTSFEAHHAYSRKSLDAALTAGQEKA